MVRDGREGYDFRYDASAPSLSSYPSPPSLPLFPAAAPVRGVWHCSRSSAPPAGRLPCAPAASPRPAQASGGLAARDEASPAGAAAASRGRTSVPLRGDSATRPASAAARTCRTSPRWSPRWFAVPFRLHLLCCSTTCRHRTPIDVCYLVTMLPVLHMQMGLLLTLFPGGAGLLPIRRLHFRCGVC